MDQGFVGSSWRMDGNGFERLETWVFQAFKFGDLFLL